MRKIAGILFFVLFVFLQYGKLLSFIYCSIRVKIAATHSVSCGCDEVLAADHEKNPFSHATSSITLKEKLDQPFIMVPRSFSRLIPGNCSRYFYHVNSHLSPGFIHPPHHPPDFMV